MLEFLTLFHWNAIAQIIIVDIILGSDNAILIALACRDLPTKQRMHGMLFGTAGAVFLRIIFVIFAIVLLDIPLLKFFGGVLLLLIGIKLITPFRRAHKINKPSKKLWSAVRAIIIADIIMSFDNVIAISGIVEQVEPYYRITLIIFGLVVSIPVMICGSKFMLMLFDPFPKIISLGASIIGWIGGGLIVSDPIVNHLLLLNTSLSTYSANIAGALFVLILGHVLGYYYKSEKKVCD
ncbi:MAG: YjbE family putative metal transport protein [Burkholderia sp.]|nr:YjbE family putative metal transport protein [Burkholderia sp.]